MKQIKKYVLILMLSMAALAMAGWAFPMQDEILSMLNVRDTFTNWIGFMCLPLWWIIVGVFEYTLIKIIYSELKHNRK